MDSGSFAAPPVGDADTQTLAKAFSSASRSRVAMAASILRDSAGTASRTPLNCRCPRTKRLMSVSDTTVAERGRRSSRASSPKYWPGPRVATLRLFRFTDAWPETIRKIRDFHLERRAAMTVLTATPEDVHGYGRVVRKSSSSDEIREIVEQKALTPETAQAREINSGIYAFTTKPLFASPVEALPLRWLLTLALYDAVFAVIAFALFDFLLED